MLKNHAKIHHEKLFKEYWELEWEFMNFQGWLHLFPHELN
jgi:hypothetical protein